MALALLAALLLPLAPLFAAPFPPVRTDAAEIVQVAPGVEYGRYELRTADGPLSVHVIAVDPHAPGIRLGAALANDKLVSAGETLSSMAHRTGAIAGINADYFDINQTNQPLNLLIRNGRLIRAPMQRPVLAIPRDGAPYISEFSLQERARLPDGTTLALSQMNDWPVRNAGVLLVTPDYGELRADPGAHLALLEPLGDGPLTAYRIKSILPADAPVAAGSYLAFGPQFDASKILPPGATITVSADAMPPLDGIDAAVGGGPLLVKDGAWYADPHGPSSGEFATHMPASGAALTADGRLLLFEIDGRQPQISIGVLQPQFAALMIAFGAQTGMQFDGGGSSTIAARLAGANDARVLNSPSDGSERRIADALLVFNDTQPGPAVRLASVPQTVRAVQGARVSILIAQLDAAGRTVQTSAQTFTATGVSRHSLFVQSGSLRMDVPVEIVRTPARIELASAQSYVLPGAAIALHARAFDERGYELALPADLPWSTDSGTINERGVLRAGTKSAHVRVRIGDLLTVQTVLVGEHSLELNAANTTFSTYPRGGPGGIDTGAPCPQCITLRYDFSGAERAAYANYALALPQETAGVAMDVFGDGGGETLRVALTNAINERFTYTAARIDWEGWRTVRVQIPAGVARPLTLHSVYAVSMPGESLARPAGALALRALRAILAGSADDPPK